MNGDRKEKPVILFIADIMTSVAGLTHLIDRLLERYAIEPVLICDNGRYETERYRVINYGEYRPQKESERHREEFFGAEKRTWKYQAGVFLRQYRTFLSLGRKCQKIIEEIRPDAVVTADDRVSGLVQGLLKHAKGIPVISVAVAISTLVQFDFRYYNLELEVPEKKSDVNRFAMHVNSDWAKERDGAVRLFYPAGILLAGKLTGMIPMHPWACGAGTYTTCALVSNDADRQSILRCRKKDVRVTGLLEEYEILETKKNAEAIRKQLREKYGLDTKRVVILSMPHFPEHGVTTWEIHRHNMILLTGALNQRYGRILISLHPKSKRDDYMFLAEEHDVRFAEEPLRDILAGADVFAAESMSSVLRWGKILELSLVILPVEMYIHQIGQEEEVAKAIDASLTGKIPLRPSFQIDRIADVTEEIMQVIQNP